MQSGTWQGIPWLAENAYAYPLLEVVHIVGIALLVGNLALVELRVWGRAPDVPLRPLAALSLQVAVCGFALALLSGLLMLAGHPGELLVNRAFRIKMALLLVAGLNALWFHRRGGLDKADRTARLQTAASLGLWLLVIICGRWIAYS